MEVVFDPDVRAVAKFMQSRLTAGRLVPVVNALTQIAPILWGRYAPETIDVLCLRYAQPNIKDREILLQGASESFPAVANADGGSAVVAGAN
jgi:hypothetical protein